MHALIVTYLLDGWLGYGWHGIAIVAVMFACIVWLYIWSGHMYFSVS